MRSQVVEAARSGAFVRFRRRFESGSTSGVVLDVGRRFFMLVLLNDGIRYDGFQCLRIEDIRSMRPDPRAAFFKAALRQRGLRRPRRPRVSLERTADMVATAGRAFPLVTIHREEVDPSCCWIGRVIDVRRGRVSLLELDPMARWESEPTAHRLSELTRLDVGGDYEDALHRVAGAS